MWPVDDRARSIAIVGAVGIPASYGGFETLAENLAIFHQGRQVPCRLVVFCSTPMTKARPLKFGRAELRYIPLKANGFSSIAYDIVSMVMAIKEGASTLLLLGVSGAIALPFIRLFSSATIYTNVDGIEWKRKKWGTLARYYLKWSERLAVRFSDVVIADNEYVSSYLQQVYGVASETIAYGADHVLRMKSTDHPLLEELGDFALSVCRIEPENNVHEILRAFSLQTRMSLVMIGNWSASEYGRRLQEKYKGIACLNLQDPIYDIGILRGFREKASLYVHGHSAGGTNPSLVEAMYCGLPVLAFDCSFNRATTAGHGRYFHTADELLRLVTFCTWDELTEIGNAMKAVADERYIWSIVANQYFSLMLEGWHVISRHGEDTSQAKTILPIDPNSQTEID
jgi:glycosyltransferase involved in cell wall biosynthesis